VQTNSILGCANAIVSPVDSQRKRQIRFLCQNHSRLSYLRIYLKLRIGQMDTPYNRLLYSPYEFVLINSLHTFLSDTILCGWGELSNLLYWNKLKYKQERHNYMLVAIKKFVIWKLIIDLNSTVLPLECVRILWNRMWYTGLQIRASLL